jgi:hypothetical protein
VIESEMIHGSCSASGVFTQWRAQS